MTFIPAVSVIIPTYNRAATLTRAINSVLNQTFPDLELIVVDDCSVDATDEIINQYRDPRINYIKHNINRGEGAARNTGIRHSRARYIAFLDSDDEWFLNKLEKQLPLIQQSEESIGVVYSHYIMRYDDGSYSNINQPSMKGNILLELLEGKCPSISSSVIIKQECFANHMHDEDLPSFQDWDLWLQISCAYEFDFIAEPLCTIYLGAPFQSTRNIEARLNGLELFLQKWGRMIAKYHGESQLRRIRDMHVSSLYAAITEAIRSGNKIGAMKQFAKLAFRTSSSYRGPFERKAIIYSLAFLAIGGNTRKIANFLKQRF